MKMTMMMMEEEEAIECVIGILKLIASKSVVFCYRLVGSLSINRQAKHNLLPTEMVRIGTGEPPRGKCGT